MCIRDRFTHCSVKSKLHSPPCSRQEGYKRPAEERRKRYACSKASRKKRHCFSVTGLRALPGSRGVSLSKLQRARISRLSYKTCDGKPRHRRGRGHSRDVRYGRALHRRRPVCPDRSQCLCKRTNSAYVQRLAICGYTPHMEFRDALGACKEHTRID